MMERLTRGLVVDGIPQITLYAEPQVVGLYRKLGFREDGADMTMLQTAAQHRRQAAPQQQPAPLQQPPPQPPQPLQPPPQLLPRLARARR
jgi:hypothetical protein